MTDLLSLKTHTQANASVIPLQYDLKKTTSGIVHIGIGAFHRAHQAVFTDDLIATGETQWKITAVSLRSANIRNIMQPQDHLYTMLERSNEKERIRLVGAIDKVLVAPENPQAVINVIADSSTKVVTLTVTEKGYCRDKSGQQLDVENDIIKSDLADLSAPKSVPGFIVAACKIRQKHQEKLTIISCDNLPSNGDITKKVVLQFAQKVDGNLALWIENNVSFCNSMVDRIVPATTAEDITHTAELLGLEDKSVVITEPFKQWVIEDNFVNERPSWDKAGAIFVKDVAAFEEMKLRLLNGAHSTLAYIGFFMGYEYIHQAVNDEHCLAFVKKLHQQLLSTLDPVDNINLPEYAATILARFGNESVPYKTTQVACDGSQKLPQRLLKPAEILASSGNISQPIAFVVASWCRFLEGVNQQGESFTVIDPLADKLVAVANQHKGAEALQIKHIMIESEVCSSALLENNDFIYQVISYLTLIHENGMRGALVHFNTETDK
ncbi:MAG: mannitol dehydrogenase family protein [Thalassotalea sp.]|nr:mannitol dehydrogenase family protein [Thalassotalea sp.]